MTAEIVLMNRSGVSLAADSAVTTGVMSVNKIFTSANKIFTLSKYNPIGVMFYNLASFMGFPWEVLIKDYRDKIGETEFSTIEDAANDFMTHLKELPVPSEVQNGYFNANLSSYFLAAKGFIVDSLKEKYGNALHDTNITLEEVENTVAEYFATEKEAFETFKESSFYKDISIDVFLKEYGNQIDDVISGCIDEFPDFTDQTKQLLHEIAYLVFSKPFGSTYSGIVFVGYGKDQIFPSLRSYLVNGKLMDTLIYSNYIHDDVDLSPGNSAKIHSFAQDDMAQIFTQGIDKKYKMDVLRHFEDTLDQYSSTVFSLIEGFVPEEYKSQLLERLKTSDSQVLTDSLEKLNNYEFERFLLPLLRIISIMPKEELAQLAESLVSVTSLKLKVTLQEETVGGPTDVAVITKGDGFIWIKRKHYFDPELNSPFFMNYNRG